MVLALVGLVSAEPPPGTRFVDTPPNWSVVDVDGRAYDSMELARILEDRKVALRLAADRRFGVAYGIGALVVGGAAAFVAVRASNHDLLKSPDRGNYVDNPTRPGMDSPGKASIRRRDELLQQEDNISIVAGFGAGLLLITAPIPLLDAAPRRRDPWRVFDHDRVAVELEPGVTRLPPAAAPDAAPAAPPAGALPRLRRPEPP